MLPYPYNRNYKIICHLWDALQKEKTWLEKGGQDFEEVIGRELRKYKSCGLLEIRKRQQRQGLSGAIHEFDLLVRIIPEVTDYCDGEISGMVIECKTFSTKQLIEKLKGEEVEKIKPPLLRKEKVETFLFKTYDVPLEREAFPGMQLDKVFLVLVSTLPPSREAFLISLVYGVTIIFPALDTFRRLLSHYDIDHEVCRKFLNKLSHSAVFYPNPYVLLREFHKRKLPKSEIDRLKVFIIHNYRRGSGELPERGRSYEYIRRNYKTFLNRLRIELS